MAAQASGNSGDSSRAVIVTLTPAGHALVERLVDQVLHREAELISCLAPHQRATLTELLRLLLRRRVVEEG